MKYGPNDEVLIQHLLMSSPEPARRKSNIEITNRGLIFVLSVCNFSCADLLDPKSC